MTKSKEELADMYITMWMFKLSYIKIHDIELYNILNINNIIKKLIESVLTICNNDYDYDYVAKMLWWIMTWGDCDDTIGFANWLINTPAMIKIELGAN